MKPDESHSGTQYRPEIDGLRALAVVPVIFFHAGFSWFRGGYLGVDVFFVISGYLITSIILGDRAAGRFSIASFYERRARRILPALFVVLTACIPLAFVLMLPVELERFSTSLLAVLAFVPNLFFWMTTSYFDAASEELPLLHTWSLGVEEQFYVVFPLLIAATWRPGLRMLAALTAVVALASLGLSEWGWRAGRLSATFFLAPTRAWELMLGSLLAIAWQSRPLHEYVSERAANSLSLAGLMVLGTCIALFDESTPMPSVYGLMPTLGTAVVIAFAKPGTAVHFVLSRPLVVGIGLVSYGAYLWHQPLFAFARLASPKPPDLLVFAGLIGATFVLAYLTWRLVEAPLRQRRKVRTSRIVIGSILLASLFAGLALFGQTTNGMAFRLDPSDRALASMADATVQGRYVIERFVSLDRDFSPAAAPHVRKMLVIGDSYAQDFVNAAFEGEALTGLEIRTGYVSADCQIYFGTAPVAEHIEPRFRPSCRDQHTSASLWRRIHDADIVVLASSWRAWAVEVLPVTLRALGLSPQQRVLVVGPKSFGEVHVKSLLRMNEAERVSVRQQPPPQAVEINRLLKQIVPRAQFVDVQSAICDERLGCQLFNAGRLLTFDGTHLTRAGAQSVGRSIWSREPLRSLAPAP